MSYIPLIGSVYPLGYSNQTPLVSSQDGITPLNRLSNPFPTGLLPAIGNSQGLLTLVGQSVSFVEPSDRTPIFHNWQFSIQREFSRERWSRLHTSGVAEFALRRRPAISPEPSIRIRTNSIRSIFLSAHNSCSLSRILSSES